MIKKLGSLIATFTGLFLLMPALALAHVVVTPAKASVGERQTFTVSVPNEQKSDVTQLKLQIPSGVQDVMPTVKPGWQINTTKSGDAIAVITWTGGSIPEGLRDDFTFSAQVPAQATQLQWKAFQTYADGTTVAWDQAPSGHHEESGNKGPYSVTDVTSDATSETKIAESRSGDFALIVAVVAIVLSFAAFVRKK